MKVGFFILPARISPKAGPPSDSRRISVSWMYTELQYITLLPVLKPRRSRPACTGGHLNRNHRNIVPIAPGADSTCLILSSCKFASIFTFYAFNSPADLYTMILLTVLFARNGFSNFIFSNAA